MRIIEKIWEGVFTALSYYYIAFVYRTSKVVKTGRSELLSTGENEKFVVGFWHGDSYCFYPLLKNSGICIITTINKRGDYITSIGRHFGYSVIRLPDESTGGNHIFKIRTAINKPEKRSLGIALDGPLGPYHVPKRFAILMATATKRRLLVISVNIKRKIQLTKRWDKYTVPLPFNSIEFHIHEPIDTKENKDENLDKKIAEMMTRGIHI